MKLYTEEVKDLNYWKNNAEEDYLTTPISVLRYISELETLTPIELPKYKEIANASNHCKDIQVKAGFLNGALWLKEQILNQNK
jgi:hypothetical protein